MDTKTAMQTLLQWVVSRVGKPDHNFGQTPCRIPYPDFVVPVDKAHRMHEVLASIRYPTPRGLIEIEDLKEVYDLATAKFSKAEYQDSTAVDIPKLMAEAASCSVPAARYLFGPGDRRVEGQLSELAYRCAYLAAERFGCKLVKSDGDLYAEAFGAPAFGFVGTSLLGAPGWEGTRPTSLKLLDYILPMSVKSPTICSLYTKASALGEYEVQFALQAAVWFNYTAPPTALINAIRRDYPDTSAPSKGMVFNQKTKAEKPKMALSAQMYRQAAYIIRSGDNPRQMLYDLLVPFIVTATYYKSNFANIKLTGPASDGMKQKMTDALNTLYANSISQE